MKRQRKGLSSLGPLLGKQNIQAKKVYCKYLGVHLDPTLNFKMHFNKILQKGRRKSELLIRHPFSIVTFMSQRIYQSMIRPIFTYCGYNRSESQKRMIHSIGKRSLEIISAKFSPQNYDLRFLAIDNFLQKRPYCFVFDCLNGTACFPFKMNYFQRSHHTALNTLKTMVKQDFTCRSFHIFRIFIAFKLKTHYNYAFKIFPRS